LYGLDDEWIRGPPGVLGDQLVVHWFVTVMLQAVPGSAGLVAAWLGLRAVRPSSGPEFTVMSAARLTDGLGRAQSTRSNRTRR
jgi:hypothetical protein